MWACDSNLRLELVHPRTHPAALPLQYMSFVRKLHKAMPPPEADGLELHELLTAKAKESWLRDSKGCAFVTRKMFGDAVFEFAYGWVIGATPENYVQFLQGLFSLIAEEVGREKWCWKEDVHVDDDDRLRMQKQTAPAPESAPRPAFVAMAMPAPKPAPKPAAVPGGEGGESQSAQGSVSGGARAAPAPEPAPARSTAKSRAFALSSPRPARAPAPAPAPARTPIHGGAGAGWWGPPPPRQDVARVPTTSYVLPGWPRASAPPPVTGGREMWSSHPSRWADKHSLVHAPWGSNSAAARAALEADDSEVLLDCRLCRATFASRQALQAHCAAAHGAEQRQGWWTVVPFEMRAREPEPPPEEERLFELPQRQVRRRSQAERQAKNALGRMAQRLTLDRLGPPVGETLKHLARSGNPG